MRWLLFRGEEKMRLAEILFGSQYGYRPGDYEVYSSIEIADNLDGRYSVWGNLESLPDDSELLQDTRRDTKKLLPKLAELASEIREEQPSGEAEEPWEDPNDKADEEFYDLYREGRI